MNSREKPRYIASNSKRQSNHSAPIKPSPVPITSIFQIEFLYKKLLLSNKIVIYQHNPGNWAQKTGISNQPSEYVTIWIGNQFPRTNEDSQNSREIPSPTEIDSCW